MPREPIDPNAMSGTLIANQEHVLDKLQVAAQMRIGPQFAHDTRLNIVTDMMRNELIASMTSYVLADKVAEEDITDTVQTPAGAFQHFKLDYAHRWTVWYLAWVCWIVRHIAARWPVRYETHTLTVHVDRFLTYPQNTYVLPEQPWGKPVMFQRSTITHRPSYDQ